MSHSLRKCSFCPIPHSFSMYILPLALGLPSMRRIRKTLPPNESETLSGNSLASSLHSQRRGLVYSFCFGILYLFALTLHLTPSPPSCRQLRLHCPVLFPRRDSSAVVLPIARHNRQSFVHSFIRSFIRSICFVLSRSFRWVCFALLILSPSCCLPPTVAIALG